MNAIAEYLASLLSQIEFMTKELKDNESDNASLHRQLDHWQEISVHWKRERDVLAQEVDVLKAEIARPESTVVSLLRAERDGLAAAGKMALDALEVATTPLATDRQEVLEAITALRQAGVQ